MILLTLADKKKEQKRREDFEKRTGSYGWPQARGAFQPTIMATTAKQLMGAL